MKQSIQQYLGVPDKWPVKENIKYPIVIMPSKEDISGAKRKDPKACALHNAACRMYGVPNCAIGGKIAYIPQRDAWGKPYIARVKANQKTARAIVAFDKTGKMPEGGFVFIPIAKVDHFAKKRKYMRKWHAGKVPPTKRRVNFAKPRLKKHRHMPMNVKVGE